MTVFDKLQKMKRSLAIFAASLNGAGLHDLASEVQYTVQALGHIIDLTGEEAIAGDDWPPWDTDYVGADDD